MPNILDPAIDYFLKVDFFENELGNNKDEYIFFFNIYCKYRKNGIETLYGILLLIIKLNFISIFYYYNIFLGYI